MTQSPNQIFDTADGSSSLISGQFGEAYHSRHGALQESNHVFINAGLKFLFSKNLDQVNILEIGFGTGLNSYLTYLESKRTPQIKIKYVGVEAYPISKSEYESLNYPQLLGLKKDEFLSLHEAPWNESLNLSSNYSQKKLHTTFEDIQTDLSFDLIYFDAFAPNVQSHLWEEPFLTKIYELCNENAVLVTYCAKGSFKRALKACGFTLESLPGPAKKREMTRATK